MNVLKPLPVFQHLDGHVVKTEKVCSQFERVAGNEPVLIPESSVTCVKFSGIPRSSPVHVDPLGKSPHPSVQMAPAISEVCVEFLNVSLPT